MHLEVEKFNLDETQLCCHAIFSPTFMKEKVSFILQTPMKCTRYSLQSLSISFHMSQKQ